MGGGFICFFSAGCGVGRRRVSGGEGFLTVSVKVKVVPELGCEEAFRGLLWRYREALRFSVRAVLEERALTLGKAHRLLYRALKERYGLPWQLAVGCYREAVAVAKSWLRNPRRGRAPVLRRYRMLLRAGWGYRILDGGVVEVAGGLVRLRMVGWDRRYDAYPSGDARLVVREDGTAFLEVAKRVPKPEPYEPAGVFAVDVNEREVVAGNSRLELRIPVPVEEALRWRRAAERLQGKLSAPRSPAWRRRRGALLRIRRLHRKARLVLEDWARKAALEIVGRAEEGRLAVAREDLTHLAGRLRRLPKSHRTALLLLGYRRLAFWIDWQAAKRGVPVVAVNPKGTSTTCPRCGSKLRENGYRRMKCPACGFEADRDTVAVLNIEKRALAALAAPRSNPQRPSARQARSNLGQTEQRTQALP